MGATILGSSKRSVPAEHREQRFVQMLDNTAAFVLRNCPLFVLRTITFALTFVVTRGHPSLMSTAPAALSVKRLPPRI